MKPLGVVPVGAVDGEPEVVDALRGLDHAFADHAQRRASGWILADFDDLADPFVAGNHNIGDRDDVLAGEKLVVQWQMPTRRERIITSLAVIEGDWMSETRTGFGSSKNRAFITRSLVQRGLSGHAFNALRADAKTALQQCDRVHELVGGNRIAIHVAGLRGRMKRGCPSPAPRGRIGPALADDDHRTLRRSLVANLDQMFGAIDRENVYLTGSQARRKYRMSRRP